MLDALKPRLHGLAQRRIALGHAVLEREHRLISEQLGGDIRQLFVGEQLRRGIAAGQRNDLGIGRKFEDFANGRAAHAAHAV